MLFDLERHEPLGDHGWNAGRARDAIAAICRDAEAAFDPVRLWAMHPGDWEPGTPEDGVMRGIYLGAAGMLHGLTRLAERGFHEPALDAADIAAGLYDGWLASPDEDGAGASLLVGSSGILLVAHRLAPSAATADRLAEAIAANAEHPANELLYGAPGTMLAARAMHERTGEQRFAALWRESARVLLERQDADGLWMQELSPTYRHRHLGAGHGFAGNVLALRGLPGELDEGRAAAIARAHAARDGALANWMPYADPAPGQPEWRVQWCHGAPGMLTSLAAIAPEDDEHGALMAAGGELVWHAGPLSRNAGLCHGTGGNGFAFLAVHARTGDEEWLARARAFAMHALAQVEVFRERDGHGRYSLFTGDIGAALLAAACLDGDPRFPGLDDL
jgi:lanthionine synthetase-like protein